MFYQLDVILNHKYQPPAAEEESGDIRIHRLGSDFKKTNIQMRYSRHKCHIFNVSCSDPTPVCHGAEVSCSIHNEWGLIAIFTEAYLKKPKGCIGVGTFHVETKKKTY